LKAGSLVTISLSTRAVAPASLDPIELEARLLGRGSARTWIRERLVFGAVIA